MTEQEDPRLPLPVPWIQLDKAPISIKNPENDLGTGRADSTHRLSTLWRAGHREEGGKGRDCVHLREGATAQRGRETHPHAGEPPHPGKMNPHDI